MLTIAEYAFFKTLLLKQLIEFGDGHTEVQRDTQ